MRATLQLVERLLPAIVARRFTVEDIRSMMATLLNDGLSGHYTDYAGAEQATMALQSLTNGLRQRGFPPQGAAQAALKRLLATVSEDESFRAEAFQVALREFRAALESGLPR